MKSTTTHIDVAIIGAGPAGCSAAIALAQAGIRVALFDKAPLGRDKTCGDALSAKSFSVLRKLNLTTSFRQETHAYPVTGALFSAPNGSHISLHFNANSAGKTIEGAICSRANFDAFLRKEAQKSGATIIDSATVTAIAQGSPHTITYTNDSGDHTLTAHRVIGADGAHSKIAKLLNPSLPKKQLLSGRCYMEGVSNLSSQMEIHFLPEVYPGYLWIFPTSATTANVGVGIAATLLKQKGITLTALFEKALGSPKVVDRFATAKPLAPFRAWPIPVHYHRGDKLEGQNLYLVGDAAGLVDIFSGEGIGNAMKSGYMAAQAIIHNLPDGSYSSQIAREMGPELELSSRVYHLTHTMPWLFNGVMKRCAKSPKLLQWLLDVAMDDGRRKELLNPWNYIKRV